MKIVRDKRLCADIDGAEFAQHLGARRRSAAILAGAGDFDHRRTERPPHRSFDHGHVLVVDQHHARERTDGRPVVDAMFERNRCLGLRRKGGIGRLLDRHEIAARLVEAGPVPGLAFGDVVLADVDHLLARLDLPLRPVKHDADAVDAVEKLNVVKDIALATVRLGEAEELTVAIDLGLPAGRQVAFEAGPVERRLSSQRPVCDHGPASPGRRAGQRTVEPVDVAHTEMCCMKGPEQAGVRVGPVSAHAGCCWARPCHWSSSRRRRRDARSRPRHKPKPRGRRGRRRWRDRSCRR